MVNAFQSLSDVPIPPYALPIPMPPANLLTIENPTFKSIGAMAQALADHITSPNNNLVVTKTLNLLHLYL